MTYTLAGLVNKDNGWGVAGDTFDTLNAMKRYGEETWFGIGDQDFATHLLRTQALLKGDSLTASDAEVDNGARYSSYDIADDRCSRCD